MAYLYDKYISKNHKCVIIVPVFQGSKLTHIIIIIINGIPKIRFLTHDSREFGFSLLPSDACVR